VDECFQINTGLVTSVVSIACLVTYGTMPENFIFISLYFVLSKRGYCQGMPQGISTERASTLVYANSFLATLNTRLVLKGRGTDNAHETVPTFLMVDTHTIPPLPRRSSDEIYSPGGKVRIWLRFLLSSHPGRNWCIKLHPFFPVGNVGSHSLLPQPLRSYAPHRSWHPQRSSDRRGYCQ